MTAPLGGAQSGTFPGMSGYKAASFRVHLGKSGAYWALVLTDTRGNRQFDRRVHAGDLRYGLRRDDPAAVLALLRRALEDCERRFGCSPSPQASAPPPGAMGGPYHSGPTSALIGYVEPAACRSDVPLPGL